MESKWWKKATIYQVYVKSFYDTNEDGIGDIRGIINKKDYFIKMGIDAIWISPIFSSPLKDNGYDISDYYEINPLFGSMDDLDELITEFKKDGIRIILDMVLNHVSDQHKWFLEGKKSKNNKYHDYFIWKDKPDNRFKSWFTESAWEYNNLTDEYYLHHFAKEQPDLNWDNEDVVNEMINIVKFWVNKGISGIRLDVITLIGKNIDTAERFDFDKLRKNLLRLKSAWEGEESFITIGESPGLDSDASLSLIENQKPLTMLFHFEYMEDIEWNGELNKWDPKPFSLEKFKKVIEDWQIKLHGKAWNTLFLNNHDFSRIVSRWGNDGKYWEESAKTIALTLHLLQGTPFVYQGEEIGMINKHFNSLSDYDDVEVHEKYYKHVIKNKDISDSRFMESANLHARDHARTPMQWSAEESNGGFSDSRPWFNINPKNIDKINVKTQENHKHSILNWYRNLISLRKTYKSDVITNGSFELLDTNGDTFCYKRKSKNEELIILTNWSNSTYMVDNILMNKKYEIIMNTHGDEFNNSLKPWQGILIKIKK